MIKAFCVSKTFLYADRENKWIKVEFSGEGDSFVKTCAVTLVVTDLQAKRYEVGEEYTVNVGDNL